MTDAVAVGYVVVGGVVGGVFGGVVGGAETRTIRPRYVVRTP